MFFGFLNNNITDIWHSKSPNASFYKEKTKNVQSLKSWRTQQLGLPLLNYLHQEALTLYDIHAACICLILL